MRYYGYNSFIGLEEISMKKRMNVFILLVLIILILAIFYNINKNINADSKISLAASKEYISLLSKFPKEKQGNSLEPALKPEGPSEQPMTYGLVLSSESLHYKAAPNKESSERIKNATRWIIDNSDLNKDGNPGWGLPQSWDAFADGTINSENHPYTITTAIVLQGLLDALSIEDFWTEVEEKEIKDLIADVILYWLKNVYIGDENIGYLGYSQEPTDMVYTPNVSGMFLSSMVRALTDCEDIFNYTEKQFVTQHAHAIANKLVKTAKLENGMPYWDCVYYPTKVGNGNTRPNDLVHHIYILWGIEEYRAHFDKINIPFNLNQSIASVDSFWRENKIYSYPQNVVLAGNQEHLKDRPANLWGVGMMLAFYAKYGEVEKANSTLKAIDKFYGPLPKLTMWPLDFSKNDNFYERYAAHVLFGLSYKEFYKN